MKISWPIIFSMAIFFFSSCGEEKTDVPEKKEAVESKDIDACSLLDKSEIEKIFAVEIYLSATGRFVIKILP